uniref:Uncharacterized protein n=1 Tax=Knipowitschia caucasica TaxID=637954 RepID=A0AAV2M0N7_KNICA
MCGVGRTPVFHYLWKESIIPFPCLRPVHWSEDACGPWLLLQSCSPGVITDVSPVLCSNVALLICPR